jgi:opacity protein-like surface antigen
MKKLFAMVVLFMLLAGAVMADEKENNWRLQAKTGIAGSLVSSYITPDITLLYNPLFVSFGGGLKSFFGTKYGDIYLAPYGTVELAWFYVNLGVSMQVKEPDEPMATPASDYSPFYFSTGLYPRIKAGPGWLVFGGNMDVLATASPVIEGDHFMETIILTMFGAGFSLVKFEAGLGYRLAL